MITTRTELGASNLARALAGAAIVFCLGCSSYDPAHLARGAEFDALQQLWPEGVSGHRVLVLAPADVREIEPQPANVEPPESPADPDDPASRYAMPLDASPLVDELRTALGLVLEGGEGAVEVAHGLDREEALRRAYEAGSSTLVLRIEVRRWDAVFLDTTAAWYPNALLLGWLMWPVGPQWWIADEVYGLDCEVAVEVLGVASERALPGLSSRVIPCRSLLPNEEESVDPSRVVETPRLALDDIERGVDLLGTWDAGNLDPDQWEKVTTILEPYARRTTAVRVAAAVAEGIRSLQGLSRAESDAKLASRHALVVGVSASTPPCLGADSDARAMSELMRGELAPLAGDGSVVESATTTELALTTPAKNVVDLVNERATCAALLAELKRIEVRAAPRDTVVLYFAGRGGQTRAAGAAGYVLHLEDGTISLAELGSALQRIPARRRLVVIDADFAQGPRGTAGRRTAPRLGGLLKGALLSGADEGAVVLATRLTPSERVQLYEEQGLLTHFLLRGLRGQADAGGDGPELRRPGRVPRHVRREPLDGRPGSTPATPGPRR